MEDADLFIDYARLDWLITGGAGQRLHAVLTWLPQHLESIANEWAVLCPIRLACGKTVNSVFIPGMFTRMGAMRCVVCCRRVGLPAGKGSPKNDAACRKLMNLPETTR